MKKKIFTIIIIIIIAIICNLFFYNLGKGNLKTENTKLEKINSTIDKYIGENEKVVTDQNIIAKIEAKDKKINYRIPIQQSVVPELQSNDYILAILEYLFTTSAVKEITMQEFNELMLDDYSGIAQAPIKSITSEQVSKEYYDVFGHQPTDYNLGPGITFDIKNYYATPMSDNKALVMYATSDNSQETSKVKRMNLKYTEDDNYYYIYFNAGIEYNGATYYSYTDYEFLSYNTHLPFKQEEIAKRKELKMTEDNANDFSIVKAFYKKSNSDVYFEKVEIVKE